MEFSRRKTGAATRFSRLDIMNAVCQKDFALMLPLPLHSVERAHIRQLASCPCFVFVSPFPTVW